MTTLTSAVRDLNDELLDELYQLASERRLLDTDGGLTVVAEVQRRAEIRLNREELGGSHEASWYDSRPLPAMTESELRLMDGNR